MSQYDLVVVGAGIHGVGVAQAAALEGWRVLVIERREQAGLETSANSSKLIHGGLRYLESGQFRLVRECLNERRVLIANAPDLVRLQPFYLPIYEGFTRSPWTIALGLKLYDLLAGKAPRSFRLPRKEWSSLPIRQEGLRAVFGYFDAQTDDTVLTRSVLESACQWGAEVRLATEVAGVQPVDGLSVQLSSGEVVTTRTLVNAAGPWVNTVAALVPGAPAPAIDWVQGVHLQLNVPSFSGCFYAEAPADGRAMFVLPWQGKTLVGTTERVLAAPVAHASEEEIDYLLDAFNHYFPKYNCGRSAIEKIYAGVRVLPRAVDTDVNRRSRETEILAQPLGEGLYLAIYGGKLTSYRATAMKVIVQLQTFLPPAQRRSDLSSAQVKLTKAASPLDRASKTNRPAN